MSKRSDKKEVFKNKEILVLIVKKRRQIDLKKMNLFNVKKNLPINHLVGVSDNKPPRRLSANLTVKQLSPSFVDRLAIVFNKLLKYMNMQQDLIAKAFKSGLNYQEQRQLKKINSYIQKSLTYLNSINTKNVSFIGGNKRYKKNSRNKLRYSRLHSRRRTRRR